jgi:Putative zinc-finger
MNDETDDLAGSLRVLAGEERRRQGPDSHPSVETLTAYHAGELTTATEEEVQEHLATCRHCTGLLLDLPAFLAPPESGADPGDADQHAAWQALRERLPGPPHRPPERGPLRRRRTLLRLAAAAMVVLAAAPLWIVARRLAAPTLPPATVDLYPTEAWRGPAAPPSPPPATVHAAAASTTLILRLARDQPGLPFALELRAAGAAGAGTAGAPEVLTVTRVIDSHTLLLVLPRHRLAPGRYRLRVLDAERAEPLADYALEVVDP